LHTDATGVLFCIRDGKWGICLRLGGEGLHVVRINIRTQTKWRHGRNLSCCMQRKNKLWSYLGKVRVMLLAMRPLWMVVLESMRL